MPYQACGLNKKFDKSKLVEFFVKSGQKRYFQEFSYGLELVRHITPKGVYIIKA